MKHLSLFFVVLSLGCGGSEAPVSDATLGHADAVEAQDVQDSSVSDHRDASMDAQLGADVSSDAPNGADARD